MGRAVITGDIIQSSNMSIQEKEWLNKSLKKSFKIWAKDFGAKSELYRGDSFQCILNSSSNSLRLMLLIKTFIKSLNPSELFNVSQASEPKNQKTILYTKNMIDARIALGIGDVDLEMPSVVTSDGPAFHISGRLLDDIKGSKQSLAIGTTDIYNDELQIEIVLLDQIISKMTALQCEVIHLKLLGYTEMQIAKRLKISQSSVNQRSNSAGWHAVEIMTNRFELMYA